MIFPSEVSRLSAKNGIGDKAIEKVYIKDYRYSEDLDFTLVNNFSVEEILQNFEIEG